MEVAVVTGPVLTDRSVVPGDGRPLKAMVRGQDSRLPLQVAPLDVAAGVARYRAAGATNPMITNIAGTDLRPALHAAVAA